MFKRIKNLEQALRMMIEADIKYKKNNIEIQGKIDDSFHNRLLKLEDNSSIVSLSLEVVELKKALHNQRESIMLLMEYFNLYFDKRAVKKNKKK